MIRGTPNSDKTRAEHRSLLLHSLDKLLAPHQTQQPMPEEKFLEAVGICHELSRYINFDKIPKRIRINGIKYVDKLLA